MPVAVPSPADRLAAVEAAWARYKKRMKQLETRVLELEERLEQDRSSKLTKQIRQKIKYRL